MNLIKILITVIILILGLIIKPVLWFVSLFLPENKTSYYHNIRIFTRYQSQCDKYWHDSFHSEAEFRDFNNNITAKFTPIGATAYYSPKPKVKFLFYEYGAQNWEGGFIYRCEESGKLWELSVPDNAYRGYFKGINLTEKEIKRFLK